MQGIFCHDLPIYKDINGIYCSTTMTNTLFSRYFDVVDKLVVPARVYSIDQTYKDAHQEPITLPGIKFIDFPNLNTPQALLRGELKAAEKVLTEEMMKVELVFIRAGTVAELGINAAKKLNKPYLLEVASCAWGSYWEHSLIGKICAPYMEWRMKNAARDAAVVIYVTNQWLQNRYPTNGCSYCVSDVNLPKLCTEILDNRLKKIANKSDTIVLGTTGVLARHKGHRYVIKAMDRLRNKFNIRYEIVGGGNSEQLRTIATKYNMTDRVIFKGQLNHNEVLNWLDDIDIYIQPSLTEGLPRALIEAMSRACPAIGSSAGGIPELLNPSNIFEKGNVDELIICLTECIENGLVVSATANFKKAKGFETDQLDGKRRKYFETYRDLVLAQNKF